MGQRFNWGWPWFWLTLYVTFVVAGRTRCQLPEYSSKVEQVHRTRGRLCWKIMSIICLTNLFFRRCAQIRLSPKEGKELSMENLYKSGHHATVITAFHFCLAGLSFQKSLWVRPDPWRSSKENLSDGWCDSFLQARCPSHHWTNSPVWAP